MAARNIVSEGNSIKRIHADLKENYLNSIDGIQVFIPNDDDIFNLHCEIKILYGPYKDVVIHSILHIPKNYPVTGPAMNIADDFKLPAGFHHHILGTSICNDMLTNFKGHFQVIDMGKEVSKASGWSSGYSLNVILSQMQIFFADPDMTVRLSEGQIKNLIEYSKNYKCKNCSDRNQYKPAESTQLDSSKSDLEKINALKSNLICGLTKNSFLTNKSILLGYPILMNIDRYNRLWPQLLIELLSYDGYTMQIQKLGFGKLENFERIKMFSPNGDLYNYWIPIYIDEDHFKRGYQLVLNSISVIRHGINGTKENDFKPEMILAVLPCLINKTIVFILNGTLFHSLAAIQAYCHLLRLYYKLIYHFPQLKTHIVNETRKFKENPMKRNKKEFPDLGEFIINLFLSGFDYEQIKHELFVEFETRQIYWIEKGLQKSIETLPVDKLKPTLFECSKVANQLLMFNIIAAKYFISDRAIQDMDQNFGFIPENLLQEFKEVILKIKKISTYEEYFDIIGIDAYKSDIDFKNLIFNCKKSAIECNYIRNYWRPL